MAALNMPPEIHRASPRVGPSSMVDKIAEKSFSGMQGLMVAEDRKLKEKDVNSLPSLMEYREAPASPSASSVTTTLSQENCGSPRTPNSPPGRTDIHEMDDERLPNELLDELCEDIGMKEGMELDFVEFLMEQDMVDPQTYMTPEAARLSGFPTPTASQTNSALNTPTNKSSSDTQQWGNHGNRNCGSPSYSIASSTNVTIATSSGSSSPVSKRFHFSNSGPSSPTRTNPPPLSHLGPQNNHVFKAPQTPPTPRRPIPSSQGAASPRSNLSVCSNQSDHSSHSNISNHSNHSSVHSNQSSNQIPQRCASPKTNGGAPSPQLPHSTTGTYNKAPPQYGQFPGQGQSDPGRPSNSNNLQKAAIANNQPYQRLGRPVPPNVNVQNFSQNQKWMSGSQSQGTMGSQTSMQGQMPNSQCVRPTDSPLDQGYFTSSDSMSVRSYGSSAASSVPSNNAMQSANSQKQMPLSSNSQVQQKSVHFTDNMNMHNSTGTQGLPYEPLYRTNVPDCELEEYQNSMRRMQSKMMPRHVKPDIGPYTVPNNNGQGTMNPYDFPSAHSNNVNMNGNHGNMNMNSPAPNMQQFDFPHKNNSDSFMDNNQNMVMYNENMQSSQGQVNNMNCQMPSSCNGPVGMQQMDPYSRGNNPCQVPDPSKGSNMYDPAGMCKTNNQSMSDSNNCQFTGHTQGNHGNMNNGMMGMNQGMMRNQGEVNQNFNRGQNYQGMPNSHDFPQQNMMAGNGDRTMHMNMPPGQGNDRMMGYEMESNRAMSGNMNNMNNMDNMYPQNQGQGMGDNMNWSGGMPPQQPNQMGTTPRSAAMGMLGPGPMGGGGQCGQLTGQQCMLPNCVNCRSGSPQRPPMMSSQQRIMQDIVQDNSSTAFRSHPLFELLRDLTIADQNLLRPNFPYHQILNLPEDFNKLLQNFIHRNPAAGNYHTNNPALDDVMMRSLRLAHHSLIGKLRQIQDKHSSSTSKSIMAMEQFCEKFDESVLKNKYIKPATLQLNGNQPGLGGPQMGSMVPPEMGTPTKVGGMGMPNMMMPGGGYGSPMAKKGLEFHNMMSPSFKQFVDIDSASDCGSVVSSSSHCNKPESKKHPSLPKEAVAMMLDWLRQHKDNPYPNDDEKAMLIKQTGLTINQINYWFTNARRRILPKWAQQCK